MTSHVIPRAPTARRRNPCDSARAPSRFTCPAAVPAAPWSPRTSGMGCDGVYDDGTTSTPSVGVPAVIGVEPGATVVEGVPQRAVRRAEPPPGSSPNGDVLSEPQPSIAAAPAATTARNSRRELGSESNMIIRTREGDECARTMDSRTHRGKRLLAVGRTGPHDGPEPLGPRLESYHRRSSGSSTMKRNSVTLRLALRISLAAAALATSLITPQRAAGQTVRGVVTPDGGGPIPGVVVSLLDSTAATTARALTDERGEYRGTPRRPGTYLLSTLRIGFHPASSEPFALGVGEEVSRRLTVSAVPVALSAVRVSGRSVCSAPRDSTAATFAVWEQARGALAAT